MTGFDNKFPLNFFQNPFRQNKVNKEPNEGVKQDETPEQSIQKQQNQSKPGESLTNTNSNVPVNQSTMTSPAVNQSALNAANKPLQNNQLNNTQNIQNQQQSPGKIDSQGAKDLPSYAGISNLSLKSWVAEHDKKGFSNLSGGEKELASTLDGIKGFQKQNYEGGGDSSKQGGRNKALFILSHIFSNIEQNLDPQTELLVNLANFKKLGSNYSKERKLDNYKEESFEYKSAPPLPAEPQFLNTLDAGKIKYMHQLLALPNEFPEFIRLLAKDNIELYGKDIISFIDKRLKYVQEETFGKEKSLNKFIADFAPLLNQNNSPMLPLILLYYPLPLPQVKRDDEFKKDWKGKESVSIVAECEIYYLSKSRGRFLIKFSLNDKDEFSFDVQTSEVNNGVVKDIEKSVSESMILLKTPPDLSEVNVLLTQEIYKATDIDEELSIVSKGPIRLEIVLAVYSALIVLNKLNDEPDPSGVIDIID